MNWLGAVTVPPRVVTTTLTLPTAWLGVMQESSVSETTVQVVDEPPKVTVCFVLRKVPVMITADPPAAGPSEGLKPLIVGADGM